MFFTLMFGYNFITIEYINGCINGNDLTNEEICGNIQNDKSEESTVECPKAYHGSSRLDHHYSTESKTNRPLQNYRE